MKRSAWKLMRETAPTEHLIFYLRSIQRQDERYCLFIIILAIISKFNI